MKAGIYVRVSTLMQIDKESLRFQEERLRQYCKSQEYSIYKVYKEEGVSAKDTNRPKLAELLQDIREKKLQVVLVTKLDRISRSLRDSIELFRFFQDQECRFISITQNIDTTGAVGRFILNVLAAIAQVEIEIDSERSSEHMHHRAAAGKWNGGPICYGFTTRERLCKELKALGKKDSEALRKASEVCPEPKRLYLDGNEVPVVRKMYDYYLKFKSLRRATHLLNKDDLRTRKGKPWATPSVARILSNPTYIGKTWYGKRKSDIVTGKLKKISPEKWKIVKGEHEGIITEEIYNKVQKLLREKYVKPSRAEKAYLLKGLLRCGLCNGSMFGYTYHKKTPKGRVPYLYYRCQNSIQKGGSICRGMNIRGEEIEKSVERTILNLANDEKFLKDRELMLETYLGEVGSIKPDIEDGKKKLVLEEKRLEDKKAVLLDKLESRLIDDADFTDRYERIKRDLESVQDSMAELASKGETIDAKKLSMEISFEDLSNLKKTWPALDDEGRQLKLQAIIDKIVVHGIKNNKLKLTMNIFLDSLNSRKKAGFVEVVSRRGRDSSRRPA